ncbi:hypothetical protein MPH_00344 [Macrophomina phaseolina MS6]|uniref:Uncharacterized protein n=1 Tax=Macrophomina phaseolina (strain MS6) TaxID=1126212 RepID=K2SBH0_MACPH|nr:hypothetical protein MPH_00344 [Macrophomina phaseolina MS6]
MASNNEQRATLLRSSAHAFCKALVSPPPPKDLLSQYFTSASSSAPPRIHEHGPHWAAKRLPFLGRTFEGTDECVKYFEVLSQTLRMKLDGSSFPGPEGFVVDLEGDAGAAARRGKAGGGGAGGADKGVKGLWTGGRKEEGNGLWSPAGRSGGGGLGGGRGSGAGKGAVSVVGRGVFESVKTGRKWEEEFVYVLSGWDSEGKFTSWEIWADPLSAWLAVQENEVEGWEKGGFAK